jgi:glycosyltransferase involved in cell wall biosynthesis
MIIIANHRSKYGNYLKEKYKSEANIIFLGPIYDINILNNLRFFCSLYFHGHTVGGTNPSLLEAMASSALIVANRNEFNEAILKEDAFYFNTPETVTSLLDLDSRDSTRKAKIANNISKIAKIYSWPQIIENYKVLFLKIVKEQRK